MEAISPFPEIPTVEARFLVGRWRARAEECRQVNRELQILTDRQMAKAKVFDECANELAGYIEKQNPAYRAFTAEGQKK